MRILSNAGHNRVLDLIRAFANTAHGTRLAGVEDAVGQVRSIDERARRADRPNVDGYASPPRRLAGNGLVREVGTGPQDPRRRYFRAGT